MKKSLMFLFSAAVLVIAFSIGAAAQAPALNQNTVAAVEPSQSVDPLPDLPVVGSLANLKKLLEAADLYSPYIVADRIRGGNVGLALPEIAQANSPIFSASAASDSSAPAVASGDYSQTNVQVQGVDEADIIKTDGKYIYQVSQNRVVITLAYPAEQMEICSIVTFDDQNFYPMEIYTDEKRLVVIGGSAREISIPGAPVANDSAGAKIYPPPFYYNPTMKAIIFDISDRKNVKRIREVELEGQYVSSRKIGSSLYLVANKGIYYANIEAGIDNPAPSFRDTAVKDGFTGLDLATVRYFPGFTTPNYLILAGLNLDLPQEQIQIQTFLGAGENVYASEQNLYTAVTEYGVTNTAAGADKGDIPDYTFSTSIYKFILDKSNISYVAQGKAPGRVLNQFSMDEYNGYFRVATTSENPWQGWDNSSRNNVYVLDKNLAVKGKIEDIAPGERIYSVRFMGEKGYVVTFRTVDPLFVLDLSNPEKPLILGALKIPGYSDYLHPYDENHILGFGKDTTEVSYKDEKGDAIGSAAYYLGFKMALFDVSDMKNPVEKFHVIIGDRGTESDLLSNHKALLFSKEKNLLAFPVTLMEYTDGRDATGAQSTPPPPGSIMAPAYGRFTFQGAYVYNLDLENGFQLKGRITHLSDEDYLKAGNYFYQHINKVERIVYIRDILYTISQGTLKANRISDLKEVATLNIP